MKFRKKPVVIDAIRWNGTAECLYGSVLPFIQEGYDDPHVRPGIGYIPDAGEIVIPTLEGKMTAKPGDWIIKGVKGELYPCKPDIFRMTYEKVE